MEQITLTSSMRTNLLSLKRTASLLDVTENRLSTGQKINSALDGPSSFYTAKSLTNRASDLMSLLDAMGQGVQTIKAATQGVETATSLLEQMQSIANQTLSDSVKQPLSNVAELTNNAEELLAQGYREINSDMSHDEIQDLLKTPDAKM